MTARELYYACRDRNLAEVARLLDEEHVSIEGRTPALDGVTPIVGAAYQGHLDVVTMLAGRGADVLSSSIRDDVSALLAAAFYDRIDVVLYLINEFGTDPQTLNRTGMSPVLHYGLRVNLEPVIKAERVAIVEAAWHYWQYQRIKDQNWGRRRDAMLALVGSGLRRCSIAAAAGPLASSSLSMPPPPAAAAATTTREQGLLQGGCSLAKRVCRALCFLCPCLCPGGQPDEQQQQQQLDTARALSPIDRSTPEANHNYLLLAVLGNEDLSRKIVEIL